MTVFSLKNQNLTMNHPATNRHFDLVFIGAGISSAYTLLNYLKMLESAQPTVPVKIAAFEKSGEFWTGVPYGKQTGSNPLLITSLREFIAQDDERRHFSEWLSENKDWVFQSAIPIKGKMMKKWWKEHAEEIAKGDWDDIFIPRRAFGLYLKNEVEMALHSAKEKGIIDYQLFTIQVDRVKLVNGIYELSVSFSQGSFQQITATKAVLAVGSPPNVGFWKDQEKIEKSGLAYIHNVYEPGMDQTLEILGNVAKKQENSGKRGVLIIGSNASTLDTLFTFSNEETEENRVDHFYVLSPNASFPHKISRKPQVVDYQPENLNRLRKTGHFVSAQILEAVRMDVTDAERDGFNISDIFPEISKSMIACLDCLPMEEQERFVAKESIEIGKLQRRAGYEYLDVVEMLKSQGRLTMISGRFSHFVEMNGETAVFEYTKGREGDIEKLEIPVQLVINCAGFQDLSKPPKGLISNLIEEGICQSNESRRGFVMNENFETNPNFYVMGPLVAGNVNKRIRVWHAESCTRIITLSRQLAEVLVA